MRAALLLTLALTSACSTSAPETGAPVRTGEVAVVALTPQPAPDPATPAAPVDVTVPRAAAQVRVELLGVSPPPDELTAELEAVESGDVRRWPVEAASGGVSVTVPIYVVPAGDYVLTLWRGDAEAIARYPFRVIVE